jgi:hypothetical protein
MSEPQRSNRYAVIQNTQEELSLAIMRESEYGMKVDTLYDKNTKSYQIPPQHVAIAYLTLTAHKDPPKFRFLSAANGTALAAMARMLSKVQEQCIDIVHTLWRQVGKACDIPCAGCWIISKSTDVPAKLRNSMKYKENWLRHLEVYDFVGMYENFVPYDMIQRLTDMYYMVFSCQSGQSQSGHRVFQRVFHNNGAFGYRNGLKKQSGQNMLSIEMKYNDRPYKGVIHTAHTKWSSLDVTAPIHNGVRFDANKLAHLTKYIIEHTFVQHEGKVYKQTTGVAMGVHNSPQTANLYCAWYETIYMLTIAQQFYNITKDQRSHKSQAKLASIMNSLILCDM